MTKKNPKAVHAITQSFIIKLILIYKSLKYTYQSLGAMTFPDHDIGVGLINSAGSSASWAWINKFSLQQRLQSIKTCKL